MRKEALQLPANVFVTAATALIVAYFLLTLVQRTHQIYSLKLEQSQLEREVVQLQSRQVELEKQRDGLLQDTDIEKVAREELNLVKPGETAVVVIPSQEAIARAELSKETAPAAPQAPDEPPWARIAGWFGGR